MSVADVILHVERHVSDVLVFSDGYVLPFCGSEGRVVW